MTFALLKHRQGGWSVFKCFKFYKTLYVVLSSIIIIPDARAIESKTCKPTAGLISTYPQAIIDFQYRNSPYNSVSIQN